MKKTYPGFRFRIYSYNTTIHTLASKLREDYHDFDSGDTDIVLILKEMEECNEKRMLLSERDSLTEYSYSTLILTTIKQILKLSSVCLPIMLIPLTWENYTSTTQ